MTKSLRKAARRIVLLVAVGVAAWAGWKWGSGVFPRLEGFLGIGAREERPGIGAREGAPEFDARADPAAGATPELAAATVERMRAFRASGAGELRLNAREITSLLRYAASERLPTGVIDPAVSFAGDRVELRARALPESLGGLRALGALAGVLPDTVAMRSRGALLPFGSGGSMFLADEIEVGAMRLPRALFPNVLAALGREPVPGLPERAMPLPSVAGIAPARVEGGELVLVRR